MFIWNYLSIRKSKVSGMYHFWSLCSFWKRTLVKFKRNTVNATVFIYLKPKSKDTNIMRSGCNSLHKKALSSFRNFWLCIHSTKVPSMSFYPDFILILSRFYPNFIQILSKFIQTSFKFYPDFIQIF